MEARRCQGRLSFLILVMHGRAEVLIPDASLSLRLVCVLTNFTFSQCQNQRAEHK